MKNGDDSYSETVVGARPAPPRAVSAEARDGSPPPPANAEADVEAARAQVRGILAQARSQRWKLQRAIEDVDDKVAQLKARVAALRSKEASLDRARADFARAQQLFS